jgi:signal transduction histidine kinase
LDLAINARDAMPNGGSSIPADIEAKVFQAFFSTQETGKGTGLGLGGRLAPIADASGAWRP